MADEMKDYHVRPWMEPCLPLSPGKRDAVMLFGAMFLVGLISIALAWFELGIAAIAILAIGYGHFVGHYYSRMMDRWRKKRSELR